METCTSGHTNLIKKKKRVSEQNFFVFKKFLKMSFWQASGSARGASDIFFFFKVLPVHASFIKQNKKEKHWCFDAKGLLSHLNTLFWL